MALEGLAALSISSNIVQLVHFSSSLLSKSRELYQSSKGLLAETIELEAIAACLQRLSKGLADSNLEAARLSENEADLVSLAKVCKNIADELIEATTQLKVQGPHKKWESFFVALKIIWKSERIDGIVKRLDLANSQMILCLLKLMNTEQSNILLSLRLLFESFGRLESQSTSNFQALRLESLNILQSLEKQEGIGHSCKECVAGHDEVSITQLQELSSKLDTLVETGGRLSTQYRIIESLSYKRMEARYEKISDAYARTFDWILSRHSRPMEMRPKHSFIEWLTSSNGIFWISGKAGSGKSTLMKFLSGHPAARCALKDWVGIKDLVTASFYFWCAGTELQKSQEGLLQSLLHNILNQCPSLIPVVLPERWEQCTHTGTSTSEWSRTELMNAFTKVSEQSTMSKKFCFFIDGLDEYDGDHQEVVDLILGFTKSKDVKICLSSRPWNVFEIAFVKERCPKLRLEDLTRDDVKLYVQKKLETNPSFCQLKAVEPKRCEKLVKELVEKAQGVFLWVYLVIRSILQGLTNADRISDLERRAANLPADLETYFRHMLGSIDIVYEQQTARIFQTALRASEPLTLMTYIMMDECEEDADFALKLKTQIMSKSEISSRHDSMKLRVNARCKDLLEVSQIKKTLLPITWTEEASTSDCGDFGEWDSSTSRNAHRESYGQYTDLHLADSYSNSFPEFEVDFLHRTVRDFLRLKEIQDWIDRRKPRRFDYFEGRCHANLAQIKVLPFRIDQLYQTGSLSCLVGHIFDSIRTLEMDTGVANVALLDELSRVMSCHNRVLTPSFWRSVQNHVDPLLNQVRQSFLNAAKQRGLELYVAQKQDDGSRDSPEPWVKFANPLWYCDTLPWRGRSLSGMEKDSRKAPKRSASGSRFAMTAPGDSWSSRPRQRTKIAGIFHGKLKASHSSEMERDEEPEQQDIPMPWVQRG